MITLLNEVKASLLLYDITKQTATGGVSALSHITVQEFNYRYFKHLDQTSFQCGPTQSTILYLTIKSPSPTQVKELYKGLLSQEDYYYSILFDPIFPDNPSPITYNSGIVVQGDIVNISEEFNSASADGLLTRIEIIIQSITYISSASAGVKNSALILNKI